MTTPGIPGSARPERYGVVGALSGRLRRLRLGNLLGRNLHRVDAGDSSGLLQVSTTQRASTELLQVLPQLCAALSGHSKLSVDLVEIWH